MGKQAAHPCILRYGYYTRDSSKIQGDKAWACSGASPGTRGGRRDRPILGLESPKVAGSVGRYHSKSPNSRLGHFNI